MDEFQISNNFNYIEKKCSISRIYQFDYWSQYLPLEIVQDLK